LLLAMSVPSERQTRGIERGRTRLRATVGEQDPFSGAGTCAICVLFRPWRAVFRTPNIRRTDGRADRADQENKADQLRRQARPVRFTPRERAQLPANALLWSTEVGDHQGTELELDS
jgi:hypothetical protein